MFKSIRIALHFILKIEISVLLFILYYVVIVPMSFFQKILNLFSQKHFINSNWETFSEKYKALDDLRREG
jgi:hypothetical protein